MVWTKKQPAARQQGRGDTLCDIASAFHALWARDLIDTPNNAQRVMDVDEVFDIWWAAFEQQYKIGGYVNFLLHPFVSGHAMRVDMIQRLIQRMKTLPGVWFPTCDTLAQHILSTHPMTPSAE